MLHYAYLCPIPRHEQLAFFTMDVLSTASETNAAGQDITGTPPAVFLYRLVPGHQTPSFGLHCAKVGTGYKLFL